MLRLEYIQEFVALAERASFTDAAERLFVTQPSLSRHIAQMEAELGVELLHRSTRQVRLSPAGERLYPIFRRMLRDYGEAVDLARVYGEGYAGRLRIGSPRFLAEEELEERILLLSRQHPEIKLEQFFPEPEQAVRQLLAGETDLTLCLETDDMLDGLSCQPFAREPLSVLLSADHPLADRKVLPLSLLRQERFLFVRSREAYNGFAHVMCTRLMKAGVLPDQLQFVPRFSDIGIGIRQSGAVCILLRRSGNLGREHLRSIPLEGPENSVTLCFCWRTGDDNPAIWHFCGLDRPEKPGP